MNTQQAYDFGYREVYLTFDCIGDTILLMSAIRYLTIQKGGKILIGTFYKEVLTNCPYCDVLDDCCEEVFSFELYDRLVKTGITPIFITATDFVKEDNLYRPVWGKSHIFANYCNKLGITSKIDIKPVFFLSDEEKGQGRFFSNTQIAIVSSGYQKYKAIPYKIAQEIVHQLNNKYGFVQIGSKEDPLLDGVLDKRETGGLRKTASILYNSDLFVGGIGGMMHLARAVDCRAVIAYSSAEPLIMENYICNINVFAPEPKCAMCGNNEAFPYFIKCPNGYSCISGIRTSDMIQAIKKQLDTETSNLEFESMFVEGQKAVGMSDYIKRFGSIK